MNAFVSVVLPVYNGALYLKEALDSILVQSYQYFECIVIDDGSTDDTLNILLEYKKRDQRLVIITRENRGLVQSLNEGILISKGKYIARMDADDISHPDRLEKQVEYMEQNEDVYLLGTNYALIFESGIDEEAKKAAEGTHRRSQAPIERKNWFLSTNETMKFIHPTIMLRRELFDKIGLYREYKLEDLELYFRTGIHHLRIDKLEEELLDYRVRNTSKSRIDKREDQTRELMEVKVEYLVQTVFQKSCDIKYLIWGADISGKIALSVIQNQLPKSKCIGYIDTFRDGNLNGYEIIKPNKISEYHPDYIFVCTNGGAVFARGYLKELGKEEIKDFFKIS